MPNSVFINLPTTDLDRAKEFFTGLGWSINPHFTDENAACVVIDDRTYLMILTREFFATFTDTPIADPRSVTQVETALFYDSREEVDALADAAVAAGGREHRSAEDHGFMYTRSFHDQDGNLFSAGWMDPRAVEMGPEAFMAEQAGAVPPDQV